MRTFFVRAVLITEYLLTSVRGDGDASKEKPEIKYLLIGIGIGLFLAILLIISKFCTFRNQVHNNNCTGVSMKTPSEPHLIPLSHLNQSVAAVSNDVQC
ncbi:hypothetical protein PAMA_012770 [Pampus argenteus]